MTACESLARSAEPARYPAGASAEVGSKGSAQRARGWCSSSEGTYPIDCIERSLPRVRVQATVLLAVERPLRFVEEFLLRGAVVVVVGVVVGHVLVDAGQGLD